MSLTRDELIVRLTRELYDLKYKLEEIRGYADKALDFLMSDDNNRPYHLVINIINSIDESAVYENTDESVE